MAGRVSRRTPLIEYYANIVCAVTRAILPAPQLSYWAPWSCYGALYTIIAIVGYSLANQYAADSMLNRFPPIFQSVSAVDTLFFFLSPYHFLNRHSDHGSSTFHVISSLHFVLLLLGSGSFFVGLIDYVRSCWKLFLVENGDHSYMVGSGFLQFLQFCASFFRWMG